jgi:hypothetical protein
MKKLLPVTGVTFALTLALAGCAADSAPEVSVKLEAPVTATPTPSASPSVEPEATPAPEATPSEGDPEVAALKPLEVTWQGLGEKKENDEYEKFPVKIAVTVPTIEKLTDEELKTVTDLADEAQRNTFAAFDFYKVNIEQTYVSGKDPVNQVSYKDFDVIDSKNAVVNDLPLIGFDWCTANSFGTDFITGTPNKSCLVGAVAKGSEPPAGVQFSQVDTEYDATDGKPVVILKKL